MVGIKKCIGDMPIMEITQRILKKRTKMAKKIKVNNCLDCPWVRRVSTINSMKYCSLVEYGDVTNEIADLLALCELKKEPVIIEIGDLDGQDNQDGYTP
jgi:hypothetical protein